MSINIHCDVSKCKNKAVSVVNEYRAGEGWNRVNVYIISREQKTFNICPDCSEKFGITKLRDAKDSGQQLLDIMYKIVDEAIANYRE